MSDTTLQKRLIFLGGSPRSGTTLVQNMLDSHPDVVGGPEFLHLPDVIALRNKFQDSIGRGWIDLFCSKDEADEHIRTLVTDLLLPFADEHGGKFLSEKTPENVLVFPKLIELFPDARFVHIVRDPRATVASLLSVGKRAKSKGEKPAPFAANTRAATLYVKRCLEAGFKATESAPEKVYTVVYENLVKDPEGETRKLCEFLNVEWSPSMLSPGEKKHLGEAAITVNSKEIWFDKKTYNSNPNTESMEKWRTSLSAYQQFSVCHVFRDSAELKNLGYDISVADMNRFSRIKGLASYILGSFPSRARQKIRRVLQTVL